MDLDWNSIKQIKIEHTISYGNTPSISIQDYCKQYQDKSLATLVHIIDHTSWNNTFDEQSLLKDFTQYVQTFDLSEPVIVTFELLENKFGNSLNSTSSGSLSTCVSATSFGNPQESANRQSDSPDPIHVAKVNARFDQKLSEAKAKQQLQEQQQQSLSELQKLEEEEGYTYELPPGQSLAIAHQSSEEVERFWSSKSPEQIPHRSPINLGGKRDLI